MKNKKLRGRKCFPPMHMGYLVPLDPHFSWYYSGLTLAG